MIHTAQSVTQALVRTSMSKEVMTPEELAERVAAVKAWMEADRENWLARVEKARAAWPKGFDEGILCGKVEND